MCSKFMLEKIPRRSALKRIAQGTAKIAAATAVSPSLSAAPKESKLKGNIRHSVCAWCYKKTVPLEELCRVSRDMGIEAIDLVALKDFPLLKKYGLISGITAGVPGGIRNGLNRVENHDEIVAFFGDALPKVANAGSPNAICFSGNLKGMSSEESLENCVTGLKRIAPIAEKAGVTICMELLNSRKNHKDYACDRTEWGVEMCKRVGSERIKLLYDIYHMQIMEGDIIQHIRDFHPYIGHYHTGGVPGRAEIDESQELFYPAIMRAILETGYRGLVAQEFIPKRKDVVASLRQAIEICDV
jgi:hydroxypyruvate isomerase